MLLLVVSLFILGVLIWMHLRARRGGSSDGASSGFFSTPSSFGGADDAGGGDGDGGGSDGGGDGGGGDGGGGD